MQIRHTEGRRIIDCYAPFNANVGVLVYSSSTAILKPLQAMKPSSYDDGLSSFTFEIYQGPPLMRRLISTPLVGA